MRNWILALLMTVSCLSAAAAERRVALIIGNDDYVTIGALKNAANDARIMDRALKAAGFETTVKIDAKRRNLYAAIDAFAAQIAASPDTVGLFYYAGHGIQANGNNYLIPVDADLESESDLEAEAVDAGKVLRAMGDAHNRMNIVVLDACRDNPLPKKSRSASRGLARMDGPTGTFIAYAAGPGQTAQDGSGDNGLFTGELVKAIALPDLPIEQVFKKAAAAVRAQTSDTQVPWIEASLLGDFYFHTKELNPPPVRRVDRFTADMHAEVDDLTIDADGTVMWNRNRVPNRLTFQGYVRVEATKDPQPELHITCAKFVKDEIVQQIVGDAQRAGLRTIELLKGCP
jgi:Caspase domain